jgi:hypothetical protein
MQSICSRDVLSIADQLFQGGILLAGLSNGQLLA